MADMFSIIAERTRNADNNTTNAAVDTEDKSMIVVDEEQIYWTKVYDLFETNYRSAMCTSETTTTKRKIHIDNCEFDVSHVHEPQMKWCPILFLDAVVHIARNVIVSSRQQACIDRRQFNQHRILRQSIEDAMVVDILPAMLAPSELPDEQNIGVSSSSSIFREGAAIGTGIAASSSSNYDDDSVHSSINVSTHSRASPISEIIGSFDERKPPSAAIVHEEKPLGNYFSKRGDTWSYRTWLSCWGSFDQLTACLDHFAGTGKSAAKHQLAGQSMVQQLQSIPFVSHSGSGSADGASASASAAGASTGNSGSDSASGAGGEDHTSSHVSRPSTFAEVFSYVKMSAQRAGTTARRNSASAAAAAASAVSSLASSAKAEELPTRRSNRTQERKHKTSRSYGSLSHSSIHSNSSSSTAASGGAHPFDYENFDETVSEGSGSGDDFIPMMASKRSRAAKMDTKSSQEDSLFNDDDGGGKMSSDGGSETGAGYGMIDKRKSRGISKRQKPLPTSSMQQSSGRSGQRGRGRGAGGTLSSSLSSSLPAASFATSAASSFSGLYRDNFPVNVNPPNRDNSYSSSGLSQIEAHDTLMADFSYQNEVIHPLIDIL